MNQRRGVNDTVMRGHEKAAYRTRCGQIPLEFHQRLAKMPVAQISAQRAGQGAAIGLVVDAGPVDGPLAYPFQIGGKDVAGPLIRIRSLVTAEGFHSQVSMIAAALATKPLATRARLTQNNLESGFSRRG